MGIHFEVPAHALTPASNIRHQPRGHGLDHCCNQHCRRHCNIGWFTIDRIADGRKHSAATPWVGRRDSGNASTINTRDPHRHRQRTRALKYLSDGYGQARMREMRPNAARFSSTAAACSWQQRTELKPAQVVLMAVSAEQTMGRPDC